MPNFVPVQTVKTNPLKPVFGSENNVRVSELEKIFSEFSPNFTFVSIYLPPSLSTRICASEASRLLSLLDGMSNVILGGDFNTRHLLVSRLSEVFCQSDLFE